MSDYVWTVINSQGRRGEVYMTQDRALLSAAALETLTGRSYHVERMALVPAHAGRANSDGLTKAVREARQIAARLKAGTRITSRGELERLAAILTTLADAAADTLPEDV